MEVVSSSISNSAVVRMNLYTTSVCHHLADLQEERKGGRGRKEGREREGEEGRGRGAS